MVVRTVLNSYGAKSDGKLQAQVQTIQSPSVNWKRSPFELFCSKIAIDCENTSLWYGKCADVNRAQCFKAQEDKVKIIPGSRQQAHDYLAKHVRLLSLEGGTQASSLQKRF